MRALSRKLSAIAAVIPSIPSRSRAAPSGTCRFSRIAVSRSTDPSRSRRAATLAVSWSTSRQSSVRQWAATARRTAGGKASTGSLLTSPSRTPSVRASASMKRTVASMAYGATNTTLGTRRTVLRSAPPVGRSSYDAGAVNVVIIEPSFPDNQKQFARALAEAGATVIGIGERPKDWLDDDVKGWLTSYEQIGSVVDEGQLYDAVRRIQGHVWVDRLEATIEAHIMAAARVRAACGIPGTSERTAFLCRDKPAMKEVLREARSAARPRPGPARATMCARSPLTSGTRSCSNRPPGPAPPGRLASTAPTSWRRRSPAAASSTGSRSRSRSSSRATRASTTRSRSTARWRWSSPPTTTPTCSKR